MFQDHFFWVGGFLWKHECCAKVEEERRNMYSVDDIVFHLGNNMKQGKAIIPL